MHFDEKDEELYQIFRIIPITSVDSFDLLNKITNFRRIRCKWQHLSGMQQFATTLSPSRGMSEMELI
jgi:hypothetical protein